MSTASGDSAVAVDGCVASTTLPTETDASSSPEAVPLSTLKFCHGCTLRIQGCREIARYLEGASSEEKIVIGSCSLCLGLLENGVRDVRQKLSTQLREAEFEGQTYHLSINLPLLCTVQHHVLLCNLRSLLCATGQAGSEPDCISVQEVLNWVLSEDLSKEGLAASPPPSGKDFPLECIKIGLTCTYDEATTPLEYLQPQAARNHTSKRRRVEAAPALTEKAIHAALGNLKPLALSAKLGGLRLAELLKRVPECAETKIGFGRSSVFLKGRYLKFSREVPQSAWIIDGERKGNSSVEEFIVSGVDRCFGARETGAFHAEGREDIDVRMLGSGRSFVVEVKDARTISCDLRKVEVDVNTAAQGLVEVRRLARCEASAMAALQRDAENHRKTYVCVCWSEKALLDKDLEVLDAVKSIEVSQKTPLRVLHRRTLAARPKTLHWIKAKKINAHYFEARLSTQAGMYIKEFVHGDLGRTSPSLKSLLKSRVEILQLDVEDLEDDVTNDNNAVSQETVHSANLDHNCDALATREAVDASTRTD